MGTEAETVQIRPVVAPASSLRTVGTEAVGDDDDNGNEVDTRQDGTSVQTAVVDGGRRMALVLLACPSPGEPERRQGGCGWRHVWSSGCGPGRG
ncbi:hypothetical protein RSAG8_08060, partial [Rhizoctonia solani AG-8 WAC10335]